MCVKHFLDVKDLVPRARKKDEKLLNDFYTSCTWHDNIVRHDAETKCIITGRILGRQQQEGPEVCLLT